MYTQALNVKSEMTRAPTVQICPSGEEEKSKDHFNKTDLTNKATLWVNYTGNTETVVTFSPDTSV